NFKILENYQTQINDCLFAGPFTGAVTICDSSGHCITTDSGFTYSGDVLNAALYDSVLNENSTLVISVTGLTFNAGCSYLNSCSTDFTSYIIGGNLGVRLSYVTMCGHDETIISDSANYFNNITEEIDDGFQPHLPTVDAQEGQTNTLNFCLEQFAGSGD